MTIKVLIVDDSASVRRELSRLVDGEDDMTVLAVAADPIAAARHIKKALPDVILLDIEMPRMDGLTFLRRIMAQRPIPVVVCSTLFENGSRACVEAFRCGAVDVMLKPNVASADALAEGCIVITDKIRAAASTRTGTAPSPSIVRERFGPDVILPPVRTCSPAQALPVVAVGASTGGTKVLEAVFRDLRPDCCGIVVAQHMPPGFTATFARRLNEVCAISVREAAAGDAITPGIALIAPGDRHMVVRRRGRGLTVDLVDGPLVSRHRPSVDVLFRSVAIAAGPGAMGVLMTGMGDDGAQGLGEMKAAGALTIAQDKASCAVFGMPGEAVRRGHADRICNPIAIARAIASHVAPSDIRGEPSRRHATGP